MNTKTVTDRKERKKLKRAARKKAAPKAKRASGVARGSLKKKIRRAAQGSGSGRKEGFRMSDFGWARSSLRSGIRLDSSEIRVHLFRTKSIDALIAASEEPGKRLAKTLGPWSLTALGIGAVIGSGIFILTGTAAAGEKLSYDSILHAPVLDLLMHGRARGFHHGPPGRGSGAFRCRFC